MVVCARTSAPGSCRSLRFCPEDRDSFGVQKKKYQTEMVASDEFSQEWKRQVERVRAAADLAAGRGRGRARGARGRGAGVGRGGGDPTRDVPPGELSQAQLRHLVPPGGHIWRSNVAGAWHGHYAPFPRRSFAWNMYGHRESALMVLRYLWTNHLTSNGTSQEACPVRGLFEPGVDFPLPDPA